MDAAGNISNKTCSVIVIPEGHYDGTASKGSKGSKSVLPVGGAPDSTAKSTKGPKSSKQMQGSCPFDHDFNDLRREYALSTERYVITSLNITWDPSRNTTLVPPPNPPPTPSVSKGSKSKKANGVKNDPKRWEEPLLWT